jgi:hypothetical protein
MTASRCAGTRWAFHHTGQFKSQDVGVRILLGVPRRESNVAYWQYGDSEWMVVLDER